MRILNAGVAAVVVFLLVLVGLSSTNALSSQPKTLQIALTPTDTSTVTSSETPSPTATAVVQPKKAYVPLFFSYRPKPPLYSTSYYMLTVDSSTLYTMGCKLGQADHAYGYTRQTVVVLDFGSPKKVGSEYGTDLFWMGPVTITQITAAVKNFGMGYYTCVADNHQSQLYVGIGTTNYHTSISNTTDFWNHGVAWANMVNAVNAWYISQGISGQVLAVGADDVELSWNSPAISKAWVNGYYSTHKYDWYDFGTLDGCANRSYPTYDKCGNGWTRDDAYYVVYGTAPAWPLPEIYLENGVNAQQWALLSLYSAMYKGYTFQFIGVFTQAQACAQSPGQCTGVDNSPAAGWNQLYDQLSADPRTYNIPTWSTDIKWWDGLAVGPTVASKNPPDLTYSQDTSSLYQGLRDSLLSDLYRPGLPDQARQVLTEKLDNVNRVLSDQAAGAAHPAPKNTKALPATPKVIDSSFPVGIFDGAGGAFHAWEGNFNNHWQGMVNGEFEFVSAGSQSDDPNQGIVMVMTVSGDRLKVQKNIYTAPAGSGSLSVSKVAWPLVTLSSSNGQTYIFNVQSSLFQ